MYYFFFLGCLCFRCPISKKAIASSKVTKISQSQGELTIGTSGQLPGIGEPHRVAQIKAKPHGLSLSRYSFVIGQYVISLKFLEIVKKNTSDRIFSFAQALAESMTQSGAAGTVVFSFCCRGYKIRSDACQASRTQPVTKIELDPFSSDTESMTPMSRQPAH